MVRHDDVGPRGDFQLADLHALGRHAFDFFQEDGRIDDDAAADDAGLIGKQDARRQKTERKGFIVDDDRMACVVAALGTDDNVRFLRQIIYDFTFTFITPLGAYYHCCSHIFNIPSLTFKLTNTYIIHENGLNSYSLAKNIYKRPGEFGMASIFCIVFTVLR